MRRKREQVRPVGRFDARSARELEERLVNERGWLERLRLILTPQLAAGERAQVVVHETDDAIEGGVVAAAGLHQQPRHFAWHVA